MQRNLGLLFLAMALASSVVGMAGAGSVKSNSGSPNIPVVAPEQTVQTVDIDGRLVRLAMSVVRTIPGAPNPDGNFPTTTVRVTMSIQDGALLPAGLKVAGVRFEKLRGIKRLFFTPVTEIQATVNGFELDAKEYTGDLSERSQVRFLKPTIRLEIGSRVIRVPMGTLPVQVIPLP